MEGTIWEAPDGNITKQIVRRGNWGLKPTENCICNIKITECSSVELDKYSVVTIGDSDTNFECLLDQCLLTMFPSEIVRVTFRLRGRQEDCFTLELVDFKSNGLIYEWSAKTKYELAIKHKQRGSELYKEFRHDDSSQRFARGLKILCAIPVEVDEPPVAVDGVKLEEIEDLKAVLYNNLASCYLKHRDYQTVLKLCLKVLKHDSRNIKALYKQAIAKCKTHDYEGSQQNLLQLLQLDPENKAASEQLKFVNVMMAESQARVDGMIKKMFGK